MDKQGEISRTAILIRNDLNYRVRYELMKNDMPETWIELKELKNPDIINHTLSIPFTSFRSSVIASKIKRILCQYTKNFKLNISFSLIKLSSVILPRLKPKKSYYLNSNLTYEYICEKPCEATYVGETKRM